MVGLGAYIVELAADTANEPGSFSDIRLPQTAARRPIDIILVTAARCVAAAAAVGDDQPNARL